MYLKVQFVDCFCLLVVTLLSNGVTVRQDSPTSAQEAGGEAAGDCASGAE